MAQNKVTVPESFYLGMIWREKDVPLGFITPDGSDQAAIKRKSTVDDWVSRNQGHRSSIKMNTCIIKNEPLTGFKLSKSQRRWSTSNVVWRVIDPRGFEIEISSENLMAILEDMIINKGEILGQMIYLRSGAANQLVSITSQEYVEATRITELTKTNLSIKDVSIGNTIMLQNGTELIYYGHYYLITANRFKHNHYIDQKIETSDKKYHVFKTIKDKRNKFVHIASPKVGSVIDDSTITKKEAYELIMKEMSEDYGSIDSLTSSYSYSNIIGIASSKNVSYNSYKKQITLEEYEVIYKEYNDRGIYNRPDLINDTADKSYYLNYYHQNAFDKTGDRDSYWREIDKIEDNTLLIAKVSNTRSYSYFGRSQYDTSMVDKTVNYKDFCDNVVGMAVLCVTITDELGEYTVYWR